MKTLYQLTLFHCLFLVSITFNNTFAQTKSGMENYQSLTKDGPAVWMPVLHCMSKHGLYGELRYNYEDVKTASVYAGKNYQGGNKFTYSVTPMLGLVFGKYNGGSVAIHVELKYRQIFYSGQLQYTVNKDDPQDDFFYNWSEMAWQPLPWLYTGISVQQTKLCTGVLKSVPGLLLGFQGKHFTVPFYLFGPFNKERNLVVGVVVEWGK